MVYNLTGMSGNITGLLSFTQAVNSTLMQGMLGVLLLIVITVICFMAFVTATGDARKAFGASSFIAFGCAIFLRAMSLIPDLALFIAIICAAGAIAFSFMGER